MYEDDDDDRAGSTSLLLAAASAGYLAMLLALGVTLGVGHAVVELVKQRRRS